MSNSRDLASAADAHNNTWRSPTPATFQDPGLIAHHAPGLHTDAQETALRPSAKIVMLGGAIKWWWQESCLECRAYGEPHVMRNEECGARIGHGPPRGHSLYTWWDSVEHQTYVTWRDAVRTMLIEEGFLTYAPWMAFKGTWDERAQAVNNAVLDIADAFVVLSPAYAVTDGTDVERQYCKLWGIPIIEAPPPEHGRTGSVIEGLLLQLGTL